MKKKEKKEKKPMSFGKKLFFLILGVAAVIGLIYLAYYLINFTFYNEYKKYVSTYEYEQGTELKLQSEKLAGYEDYKLVSETDTLKMYLNKNSSDVAIFDKRSEEITFAVPAEADNDAIANTLNKNYLKSHLIINYYNAGRTEGVYDSYSMAVERGQVTYEGIENGVRVIYDMGDYSNSIGTVPEYMTEEKLAEICEKLTEEEATSLNRYYATASDVSGMRQLLKTVRTNRNVLKKIQAMLDTVGFTEEDYAEQMELAGTTVSIPISFKIALEYRLEDDHVNVSVPVCAIEENGGAAIYRIQLLRSFGAAGSDEDGYIVVPNGDGSLIYFNNGKINATPFSQYVYGIDPLEAEYTVLENSENTTLPIFGLSKENVTILTSIEDGAALAEINAGVSGTLNTYNYAYTAFLIRGSETLEMFGTTGNESTLPIVEDKPYDCNLTVRYTFLDEEHEGYNGMAKYYRERLIEEGVLTKKDTSEDLKFYYDVIAGVEMTEYFLGKQYMGLTAMTTFEEAEEMSKLLKEAGITNQVMNLQGWFNGGYYHDVPDFTFVSWELGGKKGLESLNEAIEANGGNLYADVAFQQVTFDSKRFNYQAMSSKYYGSGYVASFGQVNPVTLRQTSSMGYSETMYDLISPKFLVRYVQAFAKDIEKINVNGISLRDLGSVLQSDKRRTNVISREQALDVVMAQLEALHATEKNILVNSANAYSWGVADDIINLPLGDNEYMLVDEDIPLYEMIVHGSIDYCGDVYNLADVKNEKELLLSMIEYGAAPHFVFTMAETTEMKYSGMNMNYSTTFATWKDKAIAIYDELDTVLGQVSGETISSHEILKDGVRKVTYSNDVIIYVNYNDTAVLVDGVNIPAMGYVVK